MCSELVPGARGEGSAVGRQWGAGDCATGCPCASLPEGTQTGCGCGQIYVQLLAGSCGKLSSIFSSNSCLDGEWRDRFFFIYTASILLVLWCWEMFTLVVFLTGFLLHLKNLSFPNVSSLLSEFLCCRWEIPGVRSVPGCNHSSAVTQTPGTGSLQTNLAGFQQLRGDPPPSNILSLSSNLS